VLSRPSRATADDGSALMLKVTHVIRGY
jgi:hypothetical protein